MGVYYLWFTKTFVLFQILLNTFINMKPFFGVLAAAAVASAAPAADPQLLQSGLPAGPLTPAWGNGVLTPRGVRPLHLEGFSEDVNQDGFVDPIGAAVAPVAVAAPVAAALPAVHYGAYALPAVKPVEVKVEKVEPVEVKAPVVTYAAAPALAHPVHYAGAYAAPAFAHTVVHRLVATHTYTVPVSTHTETVHVGTHTYTNTLPHVLGAGAPILGHLPVVAAAAEPAEAEAEAAVAAE